MQKIPKTIAVAFNRSEKIIAEARGNLGAINLSEIATILIQDIGRFAERYASDFLITWDNVRHLTGEHALTDGDEHNILVFAIRRDGVDHDRFLISRLNDTRNAFGHVFPDRVYRRIYALSIKSTVPEYGQIGYCHCLLKNITDDIMKIEHEDVADDIQPDLDITQEVSDNA